MEKTTYKRLGNHLVIK